VKYARLIYKLGSSRDLLSAKPCKRPGTPWRPTSAPLPNVSGVVRLQGIEAATTVRVDEGKTLLSMVRSSTARSSRRFVLARRREPRRGDRDCGSTSRALSSGLAIEFGRSSGRSDNVLDQVFREDWGRVLAALSAFSEDIELAEEAAQDAFATAAERWPREGAPDNPTAWLIATARNRAIDRIPPRKQSRREGRTAAVGHGQRVGETMDETATFPDERLELIFTCCHPALALDGPGVALTLRTLGGCRPKRSRAGSSSRSRR